MEVTFIVKEERDQFVPIRKYCVSKIFCPTISINKALNQFTPFVVSAALVPSPVERERSVAREEMLVTPKRICVSTKEAVVFPLRSNAVIVSRFAHPTTPSWLPSFYRWDTR